MTGYVLRLNGWNVRLSAAGSSSERHCGFGRFPIDFNSSPWRWLPFHSRSAFGKCARRAVLSMYRIRRRRAYRCQPLGEIAADVESLPIKPRHSCRHCVTSECGFLARRYSPDPRETTHRWPFSGYCQAFRSATSTSKGRVCSVSTRCTNPVPMPSVLPIFTIPMPVPPL